MKSLFISAFLFFVTLAAHAQQDYFYALTLIDNGQKVEAVRVLDNLIDSGAYADRPRFAMMTLNLAGTTKQYLKDTSGAKKCFESAMACYDTLSGPLKSDDWNHREYYKAGEDLAWIYYYRHEYPISNSILLKIGAPGEYYSATGSDVLAAEDGYNAFRACVFEKLNQPDSAFHFICEMRDRENAIVRTLDSIFNIPANKLKNVSFAPFTLHESTTHGVESGYLYAIIWQDEHLEPHSVWMVNYAASGMEIIYASTPRTEENPTFPNTAYSLSASPDGKWLAVSSSLEGVNWIDIVYLNTMIDFKTWRLQNTIDAHPGLVYFKGWQNTSVLVESDADLTRLNKKNRLSMSDLFGTTEDKQLFLFDPESGKYSKK